MPSWNWTRRTDRWRLIVQHGRDGGEPRLELFDYRTDPDETRNHAAAEPDVVRNLLNLLERVPQPD